MVWSGSVKRLALMPMTTPKITSRTAPAASTTGCRVQETRAGPTSAAAAAGFARGAGAGPSASRSVSSTAARVS